MADTLAIRRVSASPNAYIPISALRSGGPTYAKLVDIGACIGCKGCEVACKEWNDLGVEPTANFGSYQSHRDLSPKTWLLMRFNEVEIDGNLNWLIKKDACLHCEDPGCLFACPAPGAIVQYTNGIVDFNQENCIGCQYCVTGCPFDIPRFDASTRKVSKCNMCVGPGRGGARAGLREDLPDQRHLLGQQARHAGAGRPERWRRSTRAATRTRPSTTRPASAAPT